MSETLSDHCIDDLNDTRKFPTGTVVELVDNGFRVVSRPEPEPTELDKLTAELFETGHTDGRKYTELPDFMKHVHERRAEWVLKNFSRKVDFAPASLHDPDGGVWRRNTEGTYDYHYPGGTPSDYFNGLSLDEVQKEFLD